MKSKGEYKNGQKISEQKGDTLTYYYDNGVMRAKGKSIDGSMEGKWTFNRKTGQLWVIGSFKNNKKHGLWLRYDRKGAEEYRESFADGKVVKDKPIKAKSSRTTSDRRRQSSP
jgi:antitoxin component YwqK of YwqJK toxin-antitoxin module